MRQLRFKIRHVLVGFALLACIAPLYWAKSEADRMREHMHKLQAEVKAEQRRVKTLEAEMAFLSRYDRIEKMAREQFGMVPLNGAQIAQLSDLDEIAPIITHNPNQTQPQEIAAEMEAQK